MAGADDMRVGIIGCGIVGAYLAWKLAKQHEVTVFEQHNAIGKQACSGLISTRLWQFIPENKKLVENTLNSIIINFDKKSVLLNLQPKLLVIDRKLLDRYVTGLAKRAGASLLLKNKITEISETRNTVVVKDRNRQQHEFDRLVGCDGPLSLARKSLRLKNPAYRLGLFCYDASATARSNTAITYALKNGFSWIIPRGSCNEYGVLESPALAKKIFLEFCKKQKIKPKKIYSGIVPQGLIVSNSDKIALCGDACGLTKPYSGGGVIWSLTAANLLVKNFPNIRKYNSSLNKFFAPRFFFSQLLTKIVSKTGITSTALMPFLPKELLFDTDWIF